MIYIDELVNIKQYWLRFCNYVIPNIAREMSGSLFGINYVSAT